MYQIQSTIPLTGYMESGIGGRAENQDSCGFTNTPLGALAVVCDGMGGMQGGSTASKMVVDTIVSCFSAATSDSDPVHVIQTAVKTANTAVFQKAASNTELQGMGTTLTLLLVNDQCAYATHIGDSRIYQLRSSKKIFRTFDDSVVFQLVKGGAITEEEARTAGNSNIITKALGIGEKVDFDVTKLPYDKGDRFVLCSDGFWGAMPEKELLQRLCEGKDLKTSFDLTINKVEMEGRKNRPGNYDNYTAIVFDINQHSKMRSPMEKKMKKVAISLLVLLLASITLNIYQYHRDHAGDSGKTDSEMGVQQKDSTENKQQ